MDDDAGEPSDAALRAVDLFSGAGGMSTGLVTAGWRVTTGAEWEPDAAASFRLAHPHAEMLEGDAAAVDWRRFRGRVELVAGGPPCQPWSKGGTGLGARDGRDGWPAFLRAVQQIRPAAVLAENVPGLAAADGARTLAGLEEALRSLGYVVAARVLNAADFGVPQRRRRLLVVGVRGRRPFHWPAPTHGPGTTRPWAPASAVVRSAPDGEPLPAAVNWAARPVVRADPYAGMLTNGSGRPIDLTRPALTIVATADGNRAPWIDTLGVVPGYHAQLKAGGLPRTGRVPGARRITVREAAALQGLDPDTELVGSRSSVLRQIGNAVPPPLAAAVGAAVLRHVRDSPNVYQLPGAAPSPRRPQWRGPRKAVLVRLPEPLAAALALAAESDGRSVSDTAAGLLAEAMAARRQDPGQGDGPASAAVADLA